MRFRLINILKRLYSKVGWRIVFMSRYAGHRAFMCTYVWYLRKLGIKFNGMPSFIDLTCRMDTHGTIELGDKVIISQDVIILTHDYSITTGLIAAGRQPNEQTTIVRDVKIGGNTFVGIRAVILPGTKVGKNVIIGAGAVVRGDIPDGVIVIGNPATIIGKTNEWAMRRLSKNKSGDIISESMLGHPLPTIIRICK